MNKNTIIGTVSAANELHKVPGFDPMKHLRKTVNAQGESVMRLEPRYQRLWFRLAYPKGRMLLNPLRITDQLAIFEAKVFFHRDDTTPASSFTSNKTAQETANYIRAAQDEALREALDNAGFGIQLCDVTQTDASEHDSRGPSAPPSQVRINEPAEEESVSSSNNLPPVSETFTPPAPAESHAAQQPAAETPPVTQTQVQEAPAVKEPAPVVQPAAQRIKPVAAKVDAPAQKEHQDTLTKTPKDTTPREAAAPADNQQPLLTVLNFPASAAEPAPAQEAAAPEATAPAAPAVPRYTGDMPVEEIIPLMTMEEAQAVIVPRGPCTGWTMAHVAERRPSSLRFFLTSFSECSNIQKAAAALLVQDLEQKKAG